MRIQQAVKTTAKLRVVITDIFSAARIYHLTHQQILDQKHAKLYSRADYARLPRWAKSQLSGYMQAKMEAHYQYHLEWRVMLDGTLIKSDGVPEGRWVDVTRGDHVYIDKPTRWFSDGGRVK